MLCDPFEYDYRFAEHEYEYENEARTVEFRNCNDVDGYRVAHEIVTDTNVADLKARWVHTISKTEMDVEIDDKMFSPSKLP
jgi:hypothetical protein